MNTILILLPILSILTTIILCVLMYQIGYLKCRIAVIEKVIKPSIEELKAMKDVRDFAYREARWEQFESMTDKFYKMK